jgi:hypothetical protein
VRGLGSGATVAELVDALLFEPTPARSLFAQVGYSAKEIEENLSTIKNLTSDGIISIASHALLNDP